MITRTRGNEMGSTRQQTTATQKKSESNYKKTLIGGYHQYSWVRERKKERQKGARRGGKEGGRKNGKKQGRLDGFWEPCNSSTLPQ